MLSKASKIFIAGVLVAVITACSQSAESMIKRSFNDFKNAVTNGRGEEAALLVDSETLEWFDEAGTVALFSGKKEIDEAGLDLMQKISILRLRADLNKAALESLNGADIFAHFVNKKWLDTDLLNAADLNVLRVLKNEAFFGVIDEPEIFDFFPFIWENNQWKFVYWKSFPLNVALLEEDLAASGLTEDQFLLEYLKLTSHPNVTNAVWDLPK
jgi:hypothetical protein